MRNLLLTLSVLAPLAAHGQGATPPPSITNGPALVPVADVNCTALNKSTLICVRNASHQAIVRITCSGSIFGSSDLSIPNGTIRSGEMTVVDFAAGKCNTHIVAFSRDGRQHKFDGFDTTSNTSLLIDDD